jgi:predicted metal-binding protein
MQNENKSCTMCIVGKKEIQQTIKPIKTSTFGMYTSNAHKLAKVVKTKIMKNQSHIHIHTIDCMCTCKTHINYYKTHRYAHTWLQPHTH